MIGLKKNLDFTLEEKRSLVESDNPKITISRQCQLLGLARSSYYFKPKEGESEDNLRIMSLLDEQYQSTPFYGVRRMTQVLKMKGELVNHKRVHRLMKLMGIEAIYPKKKLSNKAESHKIYPYLLDGLEIKEPDTVWATDLTYIKLPGGFVYLVAIMDLYSRYVVSWELSNTMENYFCCLALERAILKGKPSIFNSDQGSQFTSNNFTSLLKKEEIQISMDGKGRVFDNIFIERLWRSVKYEEVYLKEYKDMREAEISLAKYFKFYNQERIHQSLNYNTPESVYFSKT